MQCCFQLTTTSYKACVYGWQRQASSFKSSNCLPPKRSHDFCSLASHELGFESHRAYLGHVRPYTPKPLLSLHRKGELVGCSLGCIFVSPNPHEAVGYMKQKPAIVWPMDLAPCSAKHHESSNCLPPKRSHDFCSLASHEPGFESHRSYLGHVRQSYTGNPHVLGWRPQLCVSSLQLDFGCPVVIAAAIRDAMLLPADENMGVHNFFLCVYILVGQLNHRTL
jgi:hypothetical protein